MAYLKVHRKAYSRSGYIRKSGVRVKSAYVPKTTFEIKDVGKKGRGKKIIPVHKGDLTKLGYHTSLPAGERHKALRKADKKYGTKSLFKKLNAQVIFRKRTQPKQKKIFVADRNWVAKNLLSRKERLELTRKPRIARLKKLKK